MMLYYPLIQVKTQKFQALAIRPDKELLRLRVNTDNENSGLYGLNLFDTPGSNSIYSEHEEILYQFIPDSDVLIYCVSYRVGFGSEDQSFLETVADLTKENPDIPVLLIINRVPVTAKVDDARIKEIVSNANDSLENSVEVFISPSLPQENSAKEPIPVLPELTPLWLKIKDIASDPKHLESIRDKLKFLTINLTEELKAELELKSALLTATKEDLGKLEKELAEFIDNENKSYALINECVERMSRRIPELLRQADEDVFSKLCSCVDETGKWTGAEQCTAFIFYHELPFNIKTTSKQLEEYILNELTELDKQINDLANTAVKKIYGFMDLHSDSEALKEIYTAICKKITMELTEITAKTITGKLGGIGGTASGTGNLVKMAVKKFGNVIGKTFSRKVYTNIGKFFTKKLIARAALAFQVILDVGMFLYDTHTWKPKLKNKIRSALSKWRIDVENDFINNYLAQIKENCDKSVKEIYEELRINYDQGSSQDDKNQNSGKIKELRDKILILDNNINQLKES